MVEASHVLEVSIRQPSAEITSFVHARAFRPERIRNESFQREIRTPEVATRQACACQKQLSGNSNRLRIAFGIEHVSLTVRQRMADAHSFSRVRQRIG